MGTVFTAQFVRYLRTVKSRDSGVLPIVSRGLVDQSRIKAGVERAKRALQPDVIRIMYGFTLDWTDEESLFFKTQIVGLDLGQDFPRNPLRGFSQSIGSSCGIGNNDSDSDRERYDSLPKLACDSGREFSAGPFGLPSHQGAVNL